MKRRVIVFGLVVSPLLLLLVCVAAFFLVGMTGRVLLSQEEQARLIRIVSLAPLATPVPTPSPTTIPDTKQPAPDSERPTEPTAAETTPELGLVGESQPLEAESDIPPTATPEEKEEVEESLESALPPGSVNSITQEGVATRLIIPKLNLDAPVVLSPIENQAWKVDHLGQTVGHLEGTAPPGSKSNIVLAGHVTLAAGVYGPFAGLAQLAPGDVLFVYYGQERFQYVVDGHQMVDRTSIEVTYPSETGQVTLITCNNWDDEEDRYLERLVVKGHLMDR